MNDTQQSTGPEDAETNDEREQRRPSTHRDDNDNDVRHDSGNNVGRRVNDNDLDDNDQDVDDRKPPQEFGGRKGPDPVRYGDWEKNGRCIDF